MGYAVKVEQIEASLAVYMAANITVPSRIVYPGESIDTDDVNDYAEWWVDGFRRPRQRGSNKDVLQGNVNVFIAAKIAPNLNRYVAYSISKNFSDNFEHADIEVKDYNDEATPTIGWLRIQSPSRNDITRGINARNTTGTRALELRFPAIAQEL